MQVKHPTQKVKVTLEAWEVEKLIQAAREVAEAYAIEDGARRAAWKPGARYVPPVISSSTFLFLNEFAEVLKPNP